MNTRYVDSDWKKRYKESQRENPTIHKIVKMDIEKELARIRSRSILFRDGT